jgi:hypothetical protein
VVRISWVSRFFERGSQDLTHDTYVASLLTHFFSVFTSVVEGADAINQKTIKEKKSEPNSIIKISSITICVDFVLTLIFLFSVTSTWSIRETVQFEAFEYKASEHGRCFRLLAFGNFLRTNVKREEHERILSFLTIFFNMGCFSCQLDDQTCVFGRVQKKNAPCMHSAG